MTVWNIDPTHSSIAFSVKHMMVATVRGRFSGVSGTVQFDPSDPDHVEAEATIPAATVDTRDDKRDAHLRSADFFDVERAPNITFRSTSSKRVGEGQFEIAGDLTIRGVTRTVTLRAELVGIQADSRMGTRAGVSAATTIDRKDFGLNWNMALETGGVLVSDAVKIELDLAAVQQVPATAAA